MLYFLLVSRVPSDVLTFGLVRDYGGTCPAQRDFPKCTILGSPRECVGSTFIISYPF